MSISPADERIVPHVIVAPRVSTCNCGRRAPARFAPRPRIFSESGLCPPVDSRARASLQRSGDLSGGAPAVCARAGGGLVGPRCLSGPAPSRRVRASWGRLVGPWRLSAHRRSQPAGRCSAGPPARERFRAVFTSATCVNACGKLPTRRRAIGSYCSDKSPTSFRSASRRSNSSRASA